jgi:hypothetical protein
LEALNNKLNQDFVIEYWSFDYLKGLLMNFSIPAEKREFISNLITRMEEKAAYEDEY